jgi:YD repeat-containing protein
LHSVSLLDKLKLPFRNTGNKQQLEVRLLNALEYAWSNPTFPSCPFFPTADHVHWVAWFRGQEVDVDEDLESAIGQLIERFEAHRASRFEWNDASSLRSIVDSRDSDGQEGNEGDIQGRESPGFLNFHLGGSSDGSIVTPGSELPSDSGGSYDEFFGGDVMEERRVRFYQQKVALRAVAEGLIQTALVHVDNMQLYGMLWEDLVAAGPGSVEPVDDAPSGGTGAALPVREVVA